MCCSGVVEGKREKARPQDGNVSMCNDATAFEQCSHAGPRAFVADSLVSFTKELLLWSTQDNTHCRVNPKHLQLSDDYTRRELWHYTNHGKTASFAVIHLQSKQMRKVPYFACLVNVMRGRAGQSVGLCFLRPLGTRSRKPCGVSIS
jgi:hypothetical protein